MNESQQQHLKVVTSVLEHQRNAALNAAANAEASLAIAKAQVEALQKQLAPFVAPAPTNGPPPQELVQ